MHKQLVQIRRAVILHAFAQALAQLFRTLRSREEPVEQRPQIQTGATHDDGEPLPACNFRNRRSRLPRILTRSEWLVGFGNIEKMMPHQRSLLAKLGLAVPISK